MLVTLLDMAPFYEEICPDLGWPVDHTLLDNMKQANKVELAKLEKAIEDAETNLGETEVRDALLSKAEYLCKIGDKVCAGKCFNFTCKHYHCHY